MEKLLDINGNTRTWDNLKKIEFSSGLIDGMTKHNSKLAIDMLKDFENGLNCSTKGIRTPASLLRNRRTWKLLQKRTKKDIDRISQEEITEIIKKENSEEFARNLKIIFNWLERTGRRKDNPSKHILAKDFSKGKPAWVYLGEENMKLLLNSLGFKHKAIATFLYDSGIRPEEAWKLRVYDFQDDYTVLDIPEKRSNGQRVAKKNSFGRKIKLKLSSDLIRDYVKINNLKQEDTLINITQAGFNKAMRVQAVKLFGTQPTKARESPNRITAYDVRHNSACFWLKRYKTHKDLMFRLGWKKEDKIFYYTEFLDMRDTIDDEDLITQEDKSKYEKEIDVLKKTVSKLTEVSKTNSDFLDALVELMNKKKINLSEIVTVQQKTKKIIEKNNIS